MATPRAAHNPQGLEQGPADTHPDTMTVEEKTLPDLSGKLLIAMPGLGDPRFERTVIYLCAHSTDGAMGLIVNKPLNDVAFTDLLDQLDLSAAAPATQVQVHIGGPVEPGRGFVLHSSDYSTDGGTLDITDKIGMSATVEVLEALSTGTGPKQALLALGYAGWGPGQLESELQDNGWLTGDATEDILFGANDDDKWHAAIRAMGFDPVMLSAMGGRA